jgi:hypothetical protein
MSPGGQYLILYDCLFRAIINQTTFTIRPRYTEYVQDNIMEIGEEVRTLQWALDSFKASVPT